MPGGGNFVRVERYRKRARTPRSAHARYYYTRSLVLDQPLRGGTPRTTRCQSAPKVMDSHSRSASPRDPPRPQHRPPSPPSPAPAGFDNRAYSHDEADQNHNDSFTSNPPQQNGHSKEPNGDTKTLEAVNLELINLTPKNGSKKKDVEVDMNATNPYDEYFVPVNEHRKYMRGEKLYVTADKRGEKGGCKRPLCWTLLGLVVAAIVALIVLAATGVLFTNSPTTVEQYNSSVSKARALGGLGSFNDDKPDVHDHSRHDHNQDDHVHDDHADHAHPAETTTQQATQNDEALDINLGSDEIADSSMYVPRTVEGELRIDNEEYTPEMQNPDSSEYQQFASTFSDALKRALFNRNTIENGNNDITVEVIEIKKGSLLVTYRIHWTPKPNAESNEDLLTAKLLQTKLNDYLSRNDRMISTYHVAEDKLTSRPVLDLCKFSNNECQYNCEFDDTSLDFTCTCPPGKILDIANPKKCTTLFPNSEQTGFDEDNKQKDVSLEMSPNPSTTRPVSENEKPDDFESVMNFSQNSYQKSDDSDTTTENQNIERHNSHAPEPLPEAEPRPEPTSEPEPESSTETNGVHVLHAEIDKPYFIMESEPSAKPTSEPVAEPTAEPSAEPSPEPTVELSAKSSGDLFVEPAAEPTAEPNAEPNAEPAAEPTAEPAAEPNAEPAAEPTAEPVAEPTAEPAAEPAAEPTAEPSAEPNAEPTAKPNTELSVAASAKPAEQSSGPVPEPTAEPIPSLGQSTSTETLPATPNSDSEVSLYSSIEPEPTSEPTQMNIEHHLMHIHSKLPELETTTEPEPTWEPETIKESIQHMTSTELGLHIPGAIDESDESQETEPTLLEVKPNIYRNEFVIDSETTTKDNKSHSNSMHHMLEAKNETEITTESDWLDSSQGIINIHRLNEFTQSRSFSSDDNEILAETTTNGENNNADIAFNNLINRNLPVTNEKTTFVNNEEITTMPSMEHSETTTVSVTTAAPIVTSNNNNEQSINTHSEVNIPTEGETKTTTTVAPSKSIEDILVHTTTAEPEIGTEFSLNKLNNSEEDKHLMDALNTKTENPTASESVTTEKSGQDDSMDITFEDIKAPILYNRSSKSIFGENTTTQATQEINTTTESEWLFENVTEIPYDDDMNKMKKALTTESSVIKTDELTNQSDFEPDYFSNMGTTNGKMADSDVPIYGMVQDYDGDLRVKRVNEDKETNTTPVMLVEMVTKPDSKETTTEGKPLNKVETTTISEYIYKTTGQDVILPSPEPQPAPVWEQSESGIDFSVKELQSDLNKNNSEMTLRNIPDETTTTPETTTITKKDFETDGREGSQNVTQISNLNVNVYEVSSHKQNETFSTTGTNSHSAEQEEQESENPFLPEVENNKHLVKKLQEGHDLEPNSLNETQNENLDSMSDTQVSSSNEAVTTVTEKSDNATEIIENNSNESEQDKIDNMRNSTEISKWEDTKMNVSNGMESTSVVSSFLQDTDDLDSNFVTTTAESNSVPEDLSVIPVGKSIPEKVSLKNLDKETNQNLNDITSDSTKNSDRTQKNIYSKQNSILV